MPRWEGLARREERKSQTIHQQIIKWHVQNRSGNAGPKLWGLCRKLCRDYRQGIKPFSTGENFENYVLALRGEKPPGISKPLGGERQDAAGNIRIGQPKPDSTSGKGKEQSGAFVSANPGPTFRTKSGAANRNGKKRGQPRRTDSTTKRRERKGGGKRPKSGNSVRRKRQKKNQEQHWFSVKGAYVVSFYGVY